MVHASREGTTYYNAALSTLGFGLQSIVERSYYRATPIDRLLAHYRHAPLVLAWHFYHTFVRAATEHKARFCKRHLRAVRETVSPYAPRHLIRAPRPLYGGAASDKLTSKGAPLNEA